MKCIYFQQASTPELKQPWQVVVDETGAVVYGRPDAEHLIGFTYEGTYDVPVLTRVALEDPEQAVGLCPVFQRGGEMFIVDLPVKWCALYPGDDDAIAGLRVREAEMREVLG